MTEKKNGRFIQIITAFTLAGILFFFGILLQFIFGYFPLKAIQFPVNAIIYAELFVLLPLLWLGFKKRKTVLWLSSPLAALSSITLFTILVMIMAIIPQGGHPDRLGFTRVTDSMMFALSVLFLTLALGLTTIRRLTSSSKKNVIFFLNHFGLWIVITAGSLGQADKTEVMVYCQTDQLVWYGTNHEHRQVELPFALELSKFILKEYPPKLALINPSGELMKVRGDQLKQIDQQRLFNIDTFMIKVESYYPEAFIRPDTVLNVRGLRGLGPAVLAAVDMPSGKSIRGWIAPQSVNTMARILRLSPDASLVLLPPEHAYYGAQIKLYTQSGIQGEDRLIEVNQPIRADGWTIYLQNYDSSGERDICTFIAVKDPWLPIVYAGLFLMCAGAIGLILLIPAKSFRKQS